MSPLITCVLGLLASLPAAGMPAMQEPQGAPAAVAPGVDDLLLQLTDGEAEEREALARQLAERHQGGWHLARRRRRERAPGGAHVARTDDECTLCARVSRRYRP